MKLRKNPDRNILLARISDYAVIFVGALLYAIAVNVFIASNNIVSSGITGIATMLNYIYGLPIGTCVLIMNIPLFIWGAMENGHGFLGKTVFATVLISVFIDALNPFLPKYQNDVLLAAIFGGLIAGTAFSLIFYRGGTAGGLDIVARNLNNRIPHISMGNYILIANSAIIVMAGIVYRSIESMLYPVVAIFTSVRVMDALLYGFAHNNGKLMFIISEKYDDIRREIITRISRGLTLLDSKGGYDNSDKKVILCAVRPAQVNKINKIVLNIDKTAFIITTTANAIQGKGFAEKE